MSVCPVDLFVFSDSGMPSRVCSTFCVLLKHHLLVTPTVEPPDTVILESK